MGNPSNELISKKTRSEFREYFVETTLRQIDDEFTAAGIVCDYNFDPGLKGERRTRVEQYYSTLDWHRLSDAQKALHVFENVLISLQGDMVYEELFYSLLRWLERDGFEFTNQHLETNNVEYFNHLSQFATIHDLPQLQNHISRIEGQADTDPALAIGTAKELLETTCKTILSDYQESYDQLELPSLTKKTRKVLQLLREDIPNSAKGSKPINRLLSNLGTIAQSLGELRNLYGTGHGKHGKAKGLSPRHARLATGAATTLARFLFETHEERKKTRCAVDKLKQDIQNVNK